MIPVVFTPDENFMLQTAVAILSMLQTKKPETEYDFFLVVSDGIDTESFKYLDAIRKYYPSFNPHYIFFDTGIIDEQKIHAKHITTSTYYRLFLPEMMDFDKCMYHDGDILVFDDLSDMFVDMEDEYVAGIKTIVQHQGNAADLEFQAKWGIPSMNQYIFAGDLVLNLKQMRLDHVCDRFREEMVKGYPQQDQDIINITCYNHIYFLPPRYCMLNRWGYNSELRRYKNQIFSEEELKDAEQNPAIIHFAGGIVKPWINVRAAYAKEWWALAKQLLTDDEYQSRYAYANQQGVRRDFNQLLKVLSSNDEVLIYGSGKVGREIGRMLCSNKVNVKAYVESEVNESQKTVDGLPVITVDDVHLDDDCRIIVGSSVYYTEMVAELEKRGLREKIVDYEHKSDMYYMSLDPEYYEMEYKELMLAHYGVETDDLSIDELKKKDYVQLWKKIWR